MPWMTCIIALYQTKDLLNVSLTLLLTSRVMTGDYLLYKVNKEMDED